MLLNQDLNHDAAAAWLNLNYWDKVDVFNRLVNLSNNLRSNVRLHYVDGVGFYTDYGDCNTDDAVANIGYYDLHSDNVSSQYLALLFISNLDYQLKDFLQ